jgi:hypothetical protein
MRTSPLQPANNNTALHIAVLRFIRTVPASSVTVHNWPLLFAPGILYVIQTALTTSLIVYKIHAQVRRRRDSGLVIGFVDGARPSLVSIMRIMVESAVMYTVGMLVLIVAVALDHPARMSVHACMIPVTGALSILSSVYTVS